MAHRICFSFIFKFSFDLLNMKPLSEVALGLLVIQIQIQVLMSFDGPIGSIKRHQVFGSIKRHEVLGGEKKSGSIKRHEFFGSIKKHEVSRGEGSIKRHEVSGGETKNGSIRQMR